MKQIGIGMVVGTALFWCLFFFTQTAAGNSGQVTFRVISSQTEYNSGQSTTFVYTSAVVARMSDGATVTYACDQKHHDCPLFEAGKDYSGEQNGKEMYIMMTFPDEKQAVPVKFKEVAYLRPPTAGH